MTQPNQSNQTFLLLCVVCAALFLWPVVSGGCQRAQQGVEIASWIGKLKVKPLPPEPAPRVPTTRCLIFGFKACPACRDLERSIHRNLVPLGWKVGPLPTDDIEEIDIYSPDPRVAKYKHASYPTLILVDQQGTEIDRRVWPDRCATNEIIKWIYTSRGSRVFDFDDLDRK
jgi:hypothetical protein